MSGLRPPLEYAVCGSALAARDFVMARREESHAALNFAIAQRPDQKLVVEGCGAFANVNEAVLVGPIRDGLGMRKSVRCCHRAETRPVEPSSAT